MEIKVDQIVKWVLRIILGFYVTALVVSTMAMLGVVVAWAIPGTNMHWTVVVGYSLCYLMMVVANTGSVMGWQYLLTSTWRPSTLWEICKPS